MKKLSVLVFVLAVVLAAGCTPKKKYSLSGYNVPQDGLSVYLVDETSEKRIDSTYVQNGCFSMEGRAPKDAFLGVHVEDVDWWYPIFNDGEPVRMNYEDYTLEGSYLNNLLGDCDRKHSDAYRVLDQTYNMLNSLSEKEQQEETGDFYYALFQEVLKKYRYELMGIIEQNCDNLVPVVFLPYVLRVFPDEKFYSLADSDWPFAKHPYVQAVKAKHEAQEQD